MNEASYRAFAQFWSDDVLAKEVAYHTENAAHGQNILAERAEAKRQAEEAKRIKPGDIVTSHGYPERRLLVIDPDSRTSELLEKEFWKTELRAVIMDPAYGLVGASVSGKFSEFRKVAA